MIRSPGHFLTLAIAGALLLALPVATARAQTAADLNCTGCVGARDIGKNAVNRKKIRKNSVDAARLGGNAKPAGVVSAALPGTQTPIDQTDKIVASVNVKAPGNGFAVVMMTGYFQFGGPNLAGRSLTEGTIYEDDHGIVTYGNNSNETVISPLANSRVFPVAKGTNTINLVCKTDGPQPVSVGNAQLTALFVPQSY